MNDDIPLIYTSKGNVPAAALTYETSWSDDANNTTFTETYLLEGEVVKRSVHVMTKKGLLAESLVSSIA